MSDGQAFCCSGLSPVSWFFLSSFWIWWYYFIWFSICARVCYRAFFISFHFLSFMFLNWEVNDGFWCVYRYASIRAIETKSPIDDQQWLTYWVLYSLITLFELTFSKFIEWYCICFSYFSFIYYGFEEPPCFFLNFGKWYRISSFFVLASEFLFLFFIEGLFGKRELQNAVEIFIYLVLGWYRS